uniref:WAT1-related protein n=1 Tax=Leersia perrieri TaxID=77586 RepID=A0A0D9XBU4_9ORYZ
MESTPEKVKLLLGVLALQCCLAGFHVVSRAAINMGISKIVFTVYRNCIALALLIPFAYFLEKKSRPPITFSLLVQLFFLAFCGITCNQGFYLLGLHYLSPTYASAIQNTVPAITFALAASLRLEQVNINKRYGMAKVIGTVASIGGATIITLYKGTPLLNFLSSRIMGANIVSQNVVLDWTMGCLFLLGNCIAWSGWMTPVLKIYPARLSMLALTLTFGLVQLLAIAAFWENDIRKWRLHSGEELFTILYAGLVASGLALSLQIWCIDRGGALFTAIFQPVQTVMVAILAAVILGDQLYTGGVIGAVLIVIGLYFVLWGKTEEKKSSNSNQKIQPDYSRHLLSEESSGPTTERSDVP